MNSSVFGKRSSSSKKTWPNRLQIASFVENMPDPFDIIDFNGYVLAVNPAFEELYGWNKKDIIHRYTPLIPPRLCTDFFAFLKRIRHNEKISGYQTTRLCRDRSEIEVSIDAFLLVNQKGKPAAIAEVSRNITHLKREKTLVKKLQGGWRSLARNTSHLIITIDKQEQITFANQRIKQFLGYSLEEVIDEPLSKILADEDLPIVQKTIREVIISDQTKSCVHQFKRKDGSMATYSIDWSPLKEPSGKVEGAVGIGRDATREKEKETELIRSERLEALADFVGGMAHHFNNLMTVIVLEAQLIRQEIKEPNDVIEKGLKSIIRYCFRGKKKIEQILEFVEGLSGKESLMVDINQVIKDALSDISVQLKMKAIAVNAKWGNVPSVLGCSSQMRKALTEIFINAVEAMSQEGKLDIKTSKGKNSVLISITDSGIGMSEEVQKRMFEPFFTTKEPTRNGLGATLAYGAVKKHGGKIRVFSAPKRGTTLVIELSADGAKTWGKE